VLRLGHCHKRREEADVEWLGHGAFLPHSQREWVKGGTTGVGPSPPAVLRLGVPNERNPDAP
jgi:hypothetical protein